MALDRVEFSERKQEEGENYEYFKLLSKNCQDKQLLIFVHTEFAI